MSLEEELKKDEEAIERIAYLIEFHHELGVRAESFKKLEQVLSERYMLKEEANRRFNNLKQHVRKLL